MQLSIHTDGGSKGNPGPAAIGIVAYDGAVADKNELFRYREDIGIGTNNEAEYTAVVRAFRFCFAGPFRLGFALAPTGKRRVAVLTW